MKRINLFWLGMLFWWVLPASADVYRYVDDMGVTHFTNDLSSVPENKLSEVVKEREAQNDTSGERSNGFGYGMQPGPSFSSSDRDAENRKAEALRKKKLHADKAALEAEYGLLLKEKSAIDNDASFQYRRNKYKYKHRPTVEALVKKEGDINKRMAEIESEIKSIESQL
jgi:hypothetical protein